MSFQDVMKVVQDVRWLLASILEGQYNAWMMEHASLIKKDYFKVVKLTYVVTLEM